MAMEFLKNIIDKIFQPFFTTKPTGEGTGLGLSLSYDIIKTHGGDLQVKTKEGEGSEFIIVLSCCLNHRFRGLKNNLKMLHHQIGISEIHKSA